MAEYDDLEWCEETEMFDEYLKEHKRGRASAKADSKELGWIGEEVATHYLVIRDYEILARNWRSPFGEVDIIARDGDYVVFVEVKTRSGIEKGFPEEAVDARKRSRYEKMALWFMRDFEETDVPFRFDVIGVVLMDDNHGGIRHHRNAFGEGGCL